MERSGERERWRREVESFLRKWMRSGGRIWSLDLPLEKLALPKVDRLQKNIVRKYAGMSFPLYKSYPSDKIERSRQLAIKWPWNLVLQVRGSDSLGMYIRMIGLNWEINSNAVLY